MSNVIAFQPAGSAVMVLAPDPRLPEQRRYIVIPPPQVFATLSKDH
jgi:hypothetical protein